MFTFVFLMIIQVFHIMLMLHTYEVCILFMQVAGKLKMFLDSGGKLACYHYPLQGIWLYLYKNINNLIK